MKKTALFLLAAIATIAIGGGTARADRGFWFSKTDGSWETYFNIMNVSASTTVATVTFYDMSGASLGATSRTLLPGAHWNFGAQGAVSPATTELAAANGATANNPRGTIKISSAAGAGAVVGYTTIANATMNGFNFRLPMTGANSGAASD